MGTGGSDDSRSTAMRAACTEDQGAKGGVQEEEECLDRRRRRSLFRIVRARGAIPNEVAPGCVHAESGSARLEGHVGFFIITAEEEEDNTFYMHDRRCRG